MPKARSLQPKSYTFGSKVFWFGRSGEVIDCVVVTIGADVSEDGTAAGVDSEISDVLLPPPQADIATRKMIDVTSNSIGFIRMLMVQGVQVANRLFMSYVQHPNIDFLSTITEHLCTGQPHGLSYKAISQKLVVINSFMTQNAAVTLANYKSYHLPVQYASNLFLADYARFGITHCR